MGELVSLQRRVSRVVCSSTPTQPQNTLPNHTIALVLSHDKMSRMKNGSFSGLNLYKNKQTNKPNKQTKKTTMVHAAPGGQFGIHRPLPQAMLKLEVRVDSVSYSSQELCCCPWSELLLKAIQMSLVWTSCLRPP